MYRTLLLGMPALAFLAACVPQNAAPAMPKAHTVRADDPQASDGHVLLQRLALKAPSNMADLPLAAVDKPIPVVPVAAPPFATGLQGSNDVGRATECLTAAVYYEARSETIDGQRAVAQVVLNRVRDRAFPASVCGVVYQGSGRRTGCQFSFTCDGSMDRPREQPAWLRASAIAIAALSGSVYAPIGSATYYHAASVAPWWAQSLSRIGAVGAHIFYRWHDRMERALAFRQVYSGEEPRLASDGGATFVLAGTSPTMGVAIHYGRAPDVQAGVTVHNGMAPSISASPAASFTGVRVHLGLAGGGDVAVTIHAPVSSEGVTT